MFGIAIANRAVGTIIVTSSMPKLRFTQTNLPLPVMAFSSSLAVTCPNLLDHAVNEQNIVVSGQQVLGRCHLARERLER